MKPVDVNKYIKKKQLQRPETIIKGIDPVSVTLVKEMYSNLKDRGENLVLYEKAWLSQIERIYKDKETFNAYFLHGLNALLNDAHDFLTNESKSWGIKEDQVLSLIEKILFIKMREDFRKEFFDNLESSLFAALQLDFSNKLDLTKIGDSQANIYSYKAVLINTLLEGLESSVISMASVDNILSEVPGAIVIVTDKDGYIRYANDLGKELFDEKTDLKEHIGKTINNFQYISQLLQEKGTVVNLPFELVIKKDEILTFQAKMTVKTCKVSPIVEEIIYFIQIGKSESAVEPQNIKQQVHDKIAPINSLIGGLDVISHKLIDKDSKKLLESLRNTATRLKRNAQQELQAFAGSNSQNEKIEKIDLNRMVNEVIEDVELSAKTKAEFITDIHEESFSSKPRSIYSILQNLLSNAVKFGKQTKVNQIKIRIFTQNNYMIFQISDTGVGIKKRLLPDIFSTEKYTSYFHDSHGLGLGIVKELVENLNGRIEVDSTYSVGTKFTIKLPLH